MNRYCTFVVVIAMVCAAPAFCQERQGIERRPSYDEAERWARALANDLDHLQEDLYYERGSYPRGLRDQIDDLSHSVAHFQQVLTRNSDPEHVRRDFREMDEQLHNLVATLEQSRDSWLRRQASRLLYSDEQLHYTLERRSGRVSRELLARQAHSLENQARSLEELTERVTRRDRNLREAVAEFADEAEDFHGLVEDGARTNRLRDEFRELDELWHDVVGRLNRSYYAFYLRTAAQNVNRVHNQIHDLLGIDEHQDSEPISVPNPPQRVPPQRRPVIEFEIPGIGRFQIPQ